MHSHNTINVPINLIFMKNCTCHAMGIYSSENIDSPKLITARSESVKLENRDHLLYNRRLHDTLWLF